MNQLINIFVKMMMSDPSFQNETCQNAWKAFQNNDIQTLENIAGNLCQQHGVKLEDAINKAKQNLRF